MRSARRGTLANYRSRFVNDELLALRSGVGRAPFISAILFPMLSSYARVIEAQELSNSAFYVEPGVVSSDSCHGASRVTDVKANERRDGSNQ